MIYKPLVMSNEEYHGKTKYESSSTVRKALVNPKKYLHDKTAETVPTKAMEEGTAVHTYFLEMMLKQDSVFYIHYFLNCLKGFYLYFQESQKIIQIFLLCVVKKLL